MASTLLKPDDMTMLISTAVALLIIASGVCAIFLVVSAFQRDWVQGLLCFFLPLYLAYWAFTRFEHPRRRPLLWTFYGAPVLATAIWGIFLFVKMWP